MKKVKLPVLCLVMLIMLAFAGIFGFLAGNNGIAAKAAGAYDFEVAHYYVEYDVQSDCSVNVTEDITIAYKGYSSTGFLRDIPVNGGVQIKDVKVVKYADGEIGGQTTSVYYDVYTEDSDFLTVDIGDSSLKTGREESYRLTYVYIANNAFKNGEFAINPVGHGWEASLYDVAVTVKLPDGYKGAECYVGRSGSTTKGEFTATTVDGRTVLTAYCKHLNQKEGVSFYVQFQDGAMHKHFDFTPYWFVIAGAVLLILVLAVKFLCFSKDGLTPVVNYEAPEQMDPLLMGKLIDNKVNSEDITSLIFYMADKGYLKINLDNKSNPTLIRITQELPSTEPDYVRLMFAKLFMRDEIVAVSSLSNRFFSTVDKMTAMVNSQTKGLYDSKSIGVSVLLALLGGLLLGVAPLVLAITQVSVKMLVIAPFIAIVPAVAIYALTETTIYNRLKIGGKKAGLIFAGVGAISAVLVIFYTVLAPNLLFGYAAKAILSALSCAIIVSSVFIVSRTPEYTQKLNQIVGFRNFILLVEKDKLEKLLEDDPQFYYHVLPYAQVLGVSDKWEDKFRGLTVPPPTWATSSVTANLIEFHLINSLIRSSCAGMASNMISRPSSSGRNGGFGGGGGHFSGGGFGGGGGRGR